MPFTIDNDKKKQTRILIIEDEDYSRDCISDFLELVGFTSIRAANGREGIELFGRHSPDMIITDIMMPELSGFDILKYVQNYSIDTPIIVISGTDSLSDVAQCLKLGAWDYITKPIYDFGVVEMSVLRVLEKKQLIEENRRYREYLEDEVIKRSDALLSSMVRFRTLFNLAGDALFIHDMDGRIIDCNEMAIWSVGHSRKQLLEMNIQDIIVKDDIPLFTQMLVKLQQRRCVMYDLRYILRDGTAAIMESHAAMVVTDPVPLVFVINRDITERRRLEQEREELKLQIASAQRMEIMGLLASGIAHDFNNVLTALTGYATLLKISLADASDDTVGHVNKIAEIAVKGQALTDRLMSFVCHQQRDKPVQIDIHKILKETESLLRPNSRHIKIVLDLSADNYTVLGDESQIQSVFLNLGLNARDAMQNGGKLTFKTHNTDECPGAKYKEGGFLRIDVIDNGAGIDKKYIKKVFDPLFTTKEPGKGTGLGLPGVLYCVKNLHGYIDVESTVGKGTTFKITLPLYDQNSPVQNDFSFIREWM